jgi:hypothetical protein
MDPCDACWRRQGLRVVATTQLRGSGNHRGLGGRQGGGPGHRAGRRSASQSPGRHSRRNRMPDTARSPRPHQRRHQRRAIPAAEQARPASSTSRPPCGRAPPATNTLPTRHGRSRRAARPGRLVQRDSDHRRPVAAAGPASGMDDHGHRGAWWPGEGPDDAGIEPATPSSGEDPRPRWQSGWYLPGRRRPRPLRGAVNDPGAVSCCPSLSVRGRPKAMNHLPCITGTPPCDTASSQVALIRNRLSYVVIAATGRPVEPDIAAPPSSCPVVASRRLASETSASSARKNDTRNTQSE